MVEHADVRSFEEDTNWCFPMVSQFDALPRITRNGDNIRGKHGMYCHYQRVWDRSEYDHRVYFGIGNGKILELHTTPALNPNVKEIGNCQRWQAYFGAEKGKPLTEPSSRLHYRLMIYKQEGEHLDKDKRVASLTATAVDTVTTALGMSLEHTTAIRQQFQYIGAENRRPQDHGTDPVIKEIVAAFWRLSETFAIVASGEENRHHPSANRYTSEGDPWSRSPIYLRARSLYDVIRTAIPIFHEITACNMNMPFLEVAPSAERQTDFHETYRTALNYQPARLVIDEGDRIPLISWLRRIESPISGTCL
jgi:hypothetical protein